MNKIKAEFTLDNNKTTVVYPVSIKKLSKLNSLTLTFENDEDARCQEYGLKNLNLKTIHLDNEITILEANDINYNIAY